MRHAPGDRQVTPRALACCFLVGLPLSALQAQVSIETSLDQNEYVLFEPINITVKVTNLMGDPLDLARMSGKEPWLSFTVTTLNDDEVDRTDRAWIPPRMVLMAGQVKSTSANITPLYALRDPGDYRIFAQLNLDGNTVTSRKIRFSVVRGISIWDQKYTARPDPDGTSKAMRPRLYSLVLHRGDKGQYLYARIINPVESRVYCTTCLGNVVNFGEPRARIDLKGNFHILHQSGTRIFTYTSFSAQGKRLDVRYFSNISSPPQLIVTDDGGTEIVGGEEIVPDDDKPERVVPTAPLARPPGREDSRKDDD